MKRYIYIIGTGVMLALAGCSSDDEGSWNDTAQQAFAFSGYVQPTTRANASLVDYSETLLPDNGEVGLFGYSMPNDSTWQMKLTDVGYGSATLTANTFYNQEMTYSSSDGTFSYEPLRFWPNDGSKLAFWAYYPYNASVVAGGRGENGIRINGATVGSGGFGSITFTMNNDASQQVDFMVSNLIADKTKTDYPLVNEGIDGESNAVKLSFQHMLSQVRIYINDSLYDDGSDVSKQWKRDEEGNIDGLTTTVQLASIYTQGVLTPSSSDGTSTSFSWRSLSTLGTSTISDYSYAGFSFENGKLVDKTTDGHASDKDATDYSRGNIMLVIPQELKNSNVSRIIASFSDSAGHRASLTVNLLDTNTTWLRGYIYSYAFVCHLRPGDHIVAGPEILEVTISSDTTYQW